jgi:hypothetical protein
MTRRIALIIAGCILGLAGYQAAVADAHTAQIVISCDSVGFNYASFPNDANTASYSVAVSQGSGSQSGVFSWTGTSFSGSVAIRAVGTSTVTASTTWTADDGGHASRTETLECQAPPTTTITPPPRVCPDGLPPNAGHDGQPGNDDCDHTTTGVTTSTTTSTDHTTTSLTTTTDATQATTTTQTTNASTTTKPIRKPKRSERTAAVLGTSASAGPEQLAFTP